MIKAAWIGLGAMGNPMAAHLSRHSEVISLCVYNRTTAKAEAWLKENNGTLARTPKEAVMGATLVFSSVGNDDDLIEVTSGEDGAFHKMEPGCIFIDHSTTSAEVARTQAELADAKNLAYLDAPVTGGQKGAEAGKLSIMVGGKAGALERAEPFLKAYATDVCHMGDVGAGQLTKMVNQIAIAGLVEGLAEALNFAQKSDLNIDDVLKVLTQGAARSWQMENSGKSMAQGKFDHGFAVDWMRKDLNICLTEARKKNAPLPITQMVDGYFADIQAMNGGRWDITSLIKRLEE